LKATAHCASILIDDVGVGQTGKEGTRVSEGGCAADGFNGMSDLHAGTGCATEEGRGGIVKDGRSRYL
jgi:hypothetical protein